MLVWRVLQIFFWDMVESFKTVRHVVGYGNVDVAVVIFPVEGEAAVVFTMPSVSGVFIVFPQACQEMVGIVL